MLAEIATAYVTGEHTGRPLSRAPDEVAQLAFSLCGSRGRREGHPVEGRLRAEQELVQHCA
jgi:hypothetical protein